MNFNSLEFGVFLPIIFILYWSLPHRFRWVLLLISSYYFYMSWNPKYIILIFMTTLVSYLSALALEKYRNQRIKKIILSITLMVCLGTLFFFKYFNFLSESIAIAMRQFSISLQPITLQVLLPVGISFYTFQTLSYVIDVYRGDIKAEHHFGIYATFISFFPQLVAGPIERTSNLLPQIKEVKSFDYDLATYGIKLMVWGFFKKIVIADPLSLYVNAIFNHVDEHQGFSYIIATILFTFQIYCDFSGYSDIAIGTSKLLGINLMTNFKSPYFSTSIKDFWNRWHISLSTWLRDYVYIPLGGNRVSKVRHKINLFITFLISGLWHGANWTFILWGGLHGLAQIIETTLGIKDTTSKNKHNFVWCLRVIGTFLFCSFAWILFRANSISDMLHIITHWHIGISHPISYIKNGFDDIGIGRLALCRLAFNLFLLLLFDYISLGQDVFQLIRKQHIFVRYFFYWGLLLIIIFLRSTTPSEFVYFQF